MEELLNFYKSVVRNLGLHVLDDGFVAALVKDKSQPILSDGKPFVIPTKQHIDTVLEKNDEGELEQVKVLFNPLNENVLRGDTKSLERMKGIVEHKIGHAIAGLGEMLLILASDEKYQKKTNMDINNFLAELNQAKNPGVKEVIDDKSIQNWGKVYAKSVRKAKSFSSIYLKKSAVDKKTGSKYNRLASMTLPVYDELLKDDKEVEILGVKINRKKDITVFRAIFEFIIKDIKDNGVVSYGSNNPESPGFVALMNLYIKVGNRINKLIKNIKHVDEAIADNAKLPISLTLKDVDNVDKFSKSLSLIPDEIDINKNKAIESTRHTIMDDSYQYEEPGGMDLSQFIDKKNDQQPQQQVQQTQPQAQQPQQEEEIDPIDKIMYGGRKPTNNENIGTNTDPYAAQRMNQGMNQGYNNMNNPNMGMGMNQGYNQMGNQMMNPAMGQNMNPNPMAGGMNQMGGGMQSMGNTPPLGQNPMGNQMGNQMMNQGMGNPNMGNPGFAGYNNYNTPPW